MTSPQSIFFKDGIRLEKYPEIKMKAGMWNATIPHFNSYKKEYYPRYDDFDAIHIAKVAEIPHDYNGIMGVPLTYLKYHDPNKFKIVGEANHGSDNEYDFFKPKINGKEIFKRLLIQKKRAMTIYGV